MLRLLRQNNSAIIQTHQYIIKKMYLSNVSSTEEKLIDITEKDGVRRISLCHLSTCNSLSLKMLNALQNAIKIDQNNIRSIVISSKHPKIFSAGHNLKELTEKDGSEFHQKVFETCADLMKAIDDCPVPVISAVDGLAAAAGCQLVASCDIAICTERSGFSTPGADFGIFCSTPGIPLIRNTPRKTAMYMLFTGLKLTGKEAYNAGLVSKCVANDELEKEIENVISAINKKSRAVISSGKKFINKQMNLDLSTAYSMGTKQMVENLRLKDGQEGIKSFIEKKQPTWCHKDEYKF